MKRPTLNPSPCSFIAPRLSSASRAVLNQWLVSFRHNSVGRRLLFSLLLVTLPGWAAPTLTDIQPRGVPANQAFLLTVVGTDLGEGVQLQSSLPASFTPVRGPKGETQFLVEPKAPWANGLYPVRLQSSTGISNVQLLVVGGVSPMQEEESRPGSLPNSNDSIETAQAIGTNVAIIHGKLMGAERDVYRVFGKAGEKRLFEVEARRLGSALDPVLRILHPNGQQLARNEDGLGASSDPRLWFTFPAEGYYYVEVFDARFSTQAQNFYRLKLGGAASPEEIFPLGGQRGQPVEVTLLSSAGPVTKTTLTPSPRTSNQVLVQSPQGPGLGLPFAVGDLPEWVEGKSTGAPPLPGVINGRIAAAGEVDKYTFNLPPNANLFVEVQARELGTSKLSALITVTDSEGKQLARAGDEPVFAGLTAVSQSLTARDPYLALQTPPKGGLVTVAVEDLARRGGPGFAYRLLVRQVPEDYSLTVVTPQANIPLGGTALVVVGVDRKGFDGPIQLQIANPPKGLRVEGGFVPFEGDRTSGGSKFFSRRGVLLLTAEEPFSPTELLVVGEGQGRDGKKLQRQAVGVGMSVFVNGPTAQGTVDRQRNIIAPWLDQQLPAAITTPAPAQLTVSLKERKREAEGDKYLFTYKFDGLAAGWPVPAALPNSVDVEIPGINDLRIIEMQTTNPNRTEGSFVLTTTKETMPSRYDLYLVGRLTRMGETAEIYSRPLTIQLEEVKADASGK